MIDSLDLWDFEKHRRFHLPLSPTVTTIVGPNGAGKSTIVRALRLLCLNEPRGANPARHGTKVGKVQVRVDEHKITRAKGKGKNYYRLDGKVYKAFGAEPPKEITEILQVGAINFAQQLDSHFWISESPPEVSRQLNRIVDLSVIDTTLGSLQTALRQATAEEGVCDQRLEVAVQQVRELWWAAGADKLLRRIEALEGEGSARALRVARLRDLVLGVRGAKERRASLLEPLRGLGSIVRVGKRVSGLRKEIRALEDAVAATKQEIPVVPNLSAVMKWAKLNEKDRELVQALAQHLVNIRILHIKSGEVHAHWGSLQEELDGLIAGGPCPLCGTVLPTDLPF